MCEQCQLAMMIAMDTGKLRNLRHEQTRKDFTSVASDSHSIISQSEKNTMTTCIKRLIFSFAMENSIIRLAMALTHGRDKRPGFAPSEERFVRRLRRRPH